MLARCRKLERGRSLVQVDVCHLSDAEVLDTGSRPATSSTFLPSSTIRRAMTVSTNARISQSATRLLVSG